VHIWVYRALPHQLLDLQIQKYIIQIVTAVEVTIGNCFPDAWEILPDAKGGG